MIKKLLARLLPPKNHFHGGLHITPPRHKSMSTGAPSRAAALSAEYAISLRQRDGSAYLAKVAPGERVLRGQLLAEPVNSQDAPVHAPTSGTIRAIEPRPEMHPANLPVPHLILDSDGKDEAVPPLPALDPESSDADTLRERIAACGIVGLGGAGFPTARKLGHPANTLVINAAECEPYITCDDLQIRENAADIIRGAQIAAKILNAEHIHFGIEDDKPQAIAALERAAADLNDPRIKISSVPTRYPSGNARQLFELLLGVRVPADQHASDYGLICHNSGTLKAVYDAVIRGEPLTERYTTISGEGINQPQVLRIRTGAPARDLIAQAGGEKGDNRYIIGGPMMGYEIASADTPLQKTGNSLLLLPTIEPAEESPCIRCSRCADACPMELLPQQLLWYSQSDEHKRLKQYRLFDCIECGICAAVCPSAIPLVQYYRHSKGAIRAADDKARAAEHARARHEARTARLEREAAERQAQMDARRAKLQQNPAADKPERYTPAKETAPHQLPPNDDKTTAIEAAKARAAARRAERLTQNDDASTPAQTPAADDQTAAIEAAKARAAARKAARLAQNSDTETSAKIPPSPRGGGDGGGVHPYTTEADKKPAPHQLPSEPDKTTAIEVAKARAAARKAARLAQNSDSELLLPPQRSVAGDWNSSSEGRECWDGGSVSDSDTIVETPVKIPPSPRGGGDGGGVHPYTTEADKEPAPHQLPLEPGKTAAIEAAKARAAARKAARLAKSPNNDTPLQNLLTPPQPSPTGGGSAAVTEAPTAAKSPAPRQLPPDDNKTAAIEAAKARAAARKAARLAQNGETKTPPAATSPTEQPPPLQSASAPAAGEGWGGGSTSTPSTNAETTTDTAPAPHQLPPDNNETTAIEAAKARAAARKAARLAQQPLNKEAQAQNPITPPQPSPTGGGSAAVTEAPTAAKSPAPHQLPPDPGKTATIEAAKARAAARKATRLAQNGETKTPPAATSPTEQPLPPQQSAAGDWNSSSEGRECWDGGSVHDSATAAASSTDGKTAAIEAAKARAAARKAARLAQDKESLSKNEEA